MAVWTTGVLSPEEAIKESVTVFNKQMDALISLDEKNDDLKITYEEAGNKSGCRGSGGLLG